MPYEMTVERLLDAPAETLYRLWLDPAHMKDWFCPKPWMVTRAELDPRPGGGSKVDMRGPNGETTGYAGQYLELVPGRKIVFSDAFTGDWKPKDGAPFMVATITFTPEGGKTRYVATVSHWSEADRKKHEEMGFQVGWDIAASQLEALAKTI